MLTKQIYHPYLPIDLVVLVRKNDKSCSCTRNTTDPIYLTINLRLAKNSMISDYHIKHKIIHSKDKSFLLGENYTQPRQRSIYEEGGVEGNFRMRSHLKAFSIEL